ncbi:thiolase family protein [Acrocarpospora macrocephala]|uniref:acetyl-CoA C-acyltransferase n=1 Tax=Acrocarpospora macrocephala TaxID=150177 RepID=A0A5M3WE39_9ACTN|nr:acetyl-CoA acetyltransferase [Acrocarpospora macrocephala]
MYFGAANQAGEDNRNVARMAALLAGLPTSVPGSTTNRLCASGLDAVIAAARAIKAGDGSLYIAGGVESMSRAPWVVPKPERAFPVADTTLFSTTLGWRMVNPRMPDAWTVSLGESTEQLAGKYGITRDACDEYAARSHRLAALAWREGRYAGSVIQVPDAPLDRDEGIRDGVTAESLARLRPAFRDAGTVTAGNASQLSDGAAALLLADEHAVTDLGVEPLARLTASGVHAVEPQLFGIGPVEAVRRALGRAGRTLGDVTVLELNEAFAAQTLACLGEWQGLDPAVVNPLGGAIAMGHPLGCSGARLAGSLAHQLARAGSGLGVATLCVGVGQGLAITLERG